MHLLVVNAGSSSLRYSLLRTAGSEPIAQEPIAQEPIVKEPTKEPIVHETIAHETIETHGEVDAACREMLERLRRFPAPDATGHRVVHGGSSLMAPARIDAAVIAAIETASRYAPLHNPINLEVIEACRNTWPEAVHVAVFDTAFHATVPEYAHRYALPDDVVDRHGLRRFGFHGISHEQLLLDAAAFLERPAARLNLITLHLGNGASATAIRNGRSIDTSMGMTPAEGLVMGTRSGDVDPGLLAYLARAEDLDGDALDELVNRRGGLLGLCGESDMRKVRSLALAGDGAAQRAIEVYIYRIRKYIGAFQAALGRVDAMVFSGGVGENHPWLVQEVCANLSGIRIEPPATKNLPLPVNLATNDSEIAILVIAADETRSITRQVLALLGRDQHE